MSVNIAAEKPLTDRAVQALEIPQDKPYKKADKAVPGLYIYVTPSGSKLWRLKYRLGAKEGLLALGPFPEVTVNMARDAAIDHRRQIRAGIDPAVKEKAPGGPGFGEVAYVFTRPGELRQAKWEEIDWEDRLWRIPAERMKMRREHLVPLATQVVGLLKELRAYAGESPWVLPGYHTAEQCLSEGTFKHSLKALGYSSTVITAHGFRSMASTMLNERGYNPDWIEAQLAHKDTNSIRAIYNRALYLPERRQMMQEWADYLDALRLREGVGK